MNIEDAWDVHMRRAPLDAAQGQAGRSTAARKPSLTYRAMQVSIVLVGVWTIVEMPWELSPTDSLARLAALLLAKCLLLGIGVAAFFGVRYARGFLAFVCAASVFALASTLPLEYAIARQLFTLSLIECLSKIALVASYVTWYVKRH
ncbi:hypothetical protein [Paraburkholderia sp. BCC1885]|uniref:hypothetical protein n=1 Tax=Paraburkholderia sp. BCC1885 TaxID=2562669 RepID=UPI001181F76C|nr:hypothetical protein [Paraburkholderia sp. BCC1885]